MTAKDEHHGQVVEPGEGRPQPGDIVEVEAGSFTPEPLVGADADSALAEEQGPIPELVLWAMKDVVHTHWHLLASHERHDRLRAAIGEGDGEVFAIDDGRSHVIVARNIGSSPSGVAYVLLGRQPREVYEQLAGGAAPSSTALDGAAELCLLGVAEVTEVASSNIFTVARYASTEEVPAAYLPGHRPPAITADLEITAY